MHHKSYKENMEWFKKRKIKALSLIFSFGYTTPELIKLITNSKQYNFAKRLEEMGLVKSVRLDNSVATLFYDKGYPKYLVVLTEKGLEYLNNYFNNQLEYKRQKSQSLIAKSPFELLKEIYIQRLTINTFLIKKLEYFSIFFNNPRTKAFMDFQVAFVGYPSEVFAIKIENNLKELSRLVIRLRSYFNIIKEGNLTFLLLCPTKKIFDYLDSILLNHITRYDKKPRISILGNEYDFILSKRLLYGFADMKDKNKTIFDIEWHTVNPEETISYFKNKKIEYEELKNKKIALLTEKENIEEFLKKNSLENDIPMPEFERLNEIGKALKEVEEKINVCRNEAEAPCYIELLKNIKNSPIEDLPK